MIPPHIRLVTLAISLTVVIPQIGVTSAIRCITLPSATNLNLTFHTRRVTSGPGLDEDGNGWSLDAVGSWQRPAGMFTGYGANLSLMSSANEPQQNPCDIDSTTYILTTNESVTFPDVDFGFVYEMRVRTYNASNNIMQLPELASHIEPIYSPDCYEETKSAAFCSGRAIQTTGKPVDLRIDSMTRQSDDLIQVQVSWVRPVQSNGEIKGYRVNYKQPNKPASPSTRGTETILANQEDGDWDGTLRYRHSILIPESQDDIYELTVTPHVLINDAFKFGSSAWIEFDTANVQTPQLTETRLNPADSWVPDANPTPPPRPRPNDRSLPSDDDEASAGVNKGATTSPPGDLGEWTTPPSEGGVPPSPGQPASGSLPVTASVAASVALAFLLSVVCVACVCLRRKKKEDELKKAVFIRTREEEISMYHHKGSLEKNETDYKECLPEFVVKELDRTLLKLEKELGSGQFGVVYKGYAFGVYKEEYSPVAVKSLKCTSTQWPTNSFCFSFEKRVTRSAKGP